MKQALTVVPASLAIFRDSWRRHLVAENKSPKTVRTYLHGFLSLSSFLARMGMPVQVAHITREHLEAFQIELLEQATPATARTYSAALRNFFNWLVEEGEIKQSPMARMKHPRVPEQVTPVLTDADLRKLLAVCNGNDFAGRRDLAILRMLIDTGMRVSELANLKLEHVKLDQSVAIVLGKGGRVRACAFGKRTARDLDRYLRARATHPLADLPYVWLGQRGRMMPTGVYGVVVKRASEAGIGHVHPHMFRHAFAHSWLADGGQEGDLMQLAGWKSRAMLSRYASAAAADRAIEAHRRHGIGDRL